jgi:hypothetical protein
MLHNALNNTSSDGGDSGTVIYPYIIDPFLAVQSEKLTLLPK